MIRVNDTYVIDVDALNYTVKIDRHAVDKKGNEIYSTVGYYNNLENAIRAIVKNAQSKELEEGEYSLAEAIKLIDESNMRFESLLTNALNEQSENEVIFELIDDYAVLPSKAHEEDAGFDICTPKYVQVMPGERVFVDTGVKVQFPEGYFGQLLPKSGLNVKHGIWTIGTIDYGYTGTIGVEIYNLSASSYAFDIGDKISQLVILPNIKAKAVHGHVKCDTERGDNGFGSSGR